MIVLTDTIREQAPLGYLHLFKTAGTTLESIILRQYDPQRVMRFGSVKETEAKLQDFQPWPPEKKALLQAFMGHFNFQQRSMLPPETQMITILREPVSRVISEYYFILESPENVHYPKLVKNSWDLAGYMQSGLYQSLDNYQTKYLSGGNNPGFGEYSRDALERAKDNLEREFVLVGLVDRFDEFIILLKRKFGWKMPFYIRERITRSRPAKESLPENQIQVVKDYNRMDSELYEHASALFDTQVALQDKSFAEEVQAFGLLNQQYPGFIQTLPPDLDSDYFEKALIFHTLSVLLPEKRYQDLEAVLAYAVRRFPDSTEIRQVSEMLKLQLQYVRSTEGVLGKLDARLPGEEIPSDHS